jgi:LacI family transcriptional regulator
MGNVTISDIARNAGVGKATVSRVINGTGYVQAETRKKIEEMMKRYKYTPSATARNLSKRESNTIGVIIPEADNQFFAEILKGISNVVDANNLTLMFCNTNNTPEKDAKSLLIMQQQRVKGLIFTPAIDYQKPEEYEKIKDLINGVHAPVVLMDRMIGNANYDGVYFDNCESAYLATEVLIKSGYKKIGVLAGDLNLYIGRERLAGYKKALVKYHIEVEEHYILHSNFNMNTAYDLTKQILQSSDRPDAFLACNNLSSMGFLKAILEMGLRIPDDLGYMGIDRVYGLDFFGFRYSYVDRDVPFMGAEAMRLLLRNIENPNQPNEQIILPPHLHLIGSENSNSNHA